MGMDADEKLTQLKIAYADMILNTAKEAAARIMVSERRALRLELELKHSKENAIHMLMRLKQTIDSKMSEAEMVSRAQQKKIEELEAQLQEAEDIVKDLREELSAVQAELERVSAREEVKPMLQAYEALEKNAFPPPEEQPDIVPPFDIGNSDKDGDNKGGQRLHNSLFPFWKSCSINDQDLPSIILRSKGTKLYRSGCTQRIRACELERELSLPEETITKADKGEKLHKALSLGDERKKSRKRASPNTKKRTSCPNKVKEMDHVADNSYLTTTSRSVKRSNPDGSSMNATGTDLVRLSDVHSRIREELQLQKLELPLSSEAQVDPPESNKALETDGLPIQIQPTSSSRVIMYTFQRKRKRGTDGSDLRNLKKKKEENKTATSKTISMKESTQEETAKVTSIEELTEVGTEKAISMEESTLEETVKAISVEEESTEKVISVEESTEEGTEKAFTLEESTLEETEKVISIEESTQEGTEKVTTMEESTEEGTEKVISVEESTLEETEKGVSIEESTLEERRLEQVAQQLISLSEKVVAMKKQMQIEI